MALHDTPGTPYSCLVIFLHGPRYIWVWVSIREDINSKRTFSFGHCPNHLNTPPPPPPNSGNLVLFFGRQKPRFACMTGKDFDDDNDGCNDNYDGNFDDNYDKND